MPFCFRSPRTHAPVADSLLQTHACLLSLPPGVRVLGMSYYRAAQLALLLGPSTDPRVSEGDSGNGAAGGGLSLLALVPTDGLTMCEVSSEINASGGAGDAWPAAAVVATVAGGQPLASVAQVGRCDCT